MKHERLKRNIANLDKLKNQFMVNGKPGQEESMRGFFASVDPQDSDRYS